MRDNKLGSTGLFVAALSLGTMTFGSVGPYGNTAAVPQAEAGLRALDAVSARLPEYPGWMLMMLSQARVQQLEDARPRVAHAGEPE